MCPRLGLLASEHDRRALAKADRRHICLRRRRGAAASSCFVLCRSRPRSLSDGGLQLLARLLERAAFIQRTSKIAVSLSVIPIAQIESNLKLVDRLFELSAAVQHQAKIVMSISCGVALSDCSFQ